MNYALITGGSRGIGRAVCQKLAAMGFPVLINYQSNRDAALETQKLIAEAGGVAELLPFDVCDSEAVDQAIDTWQAAHPDDYIGVLVNNAGIRKDTLMVFMQNSDWQSVLNTTLNGFFYTTRRLLKGMIGHRKGRIINMASLSGLKGQAGQTNYSAAKAALIGATKALAQEIGSRNITVNAVAPGFIQTDMTKDFNEADFKKMIPAGRFGKPEEVAALVGFLASDDAAYITGEAISINGGLYT
ncbi:MAG: 3-oxoacyl-ACP reductase FabG [Bacteroidales bacterium]|nr:3-oxoacyl-ACP reductase FabG [Bacteroidales bacterium]MBR6160420.1 3-oxoacyl-ACP reductase FabG [Bacteroidales bacterium]